MNNLNIPIAFMAGVVSFFAPCVIPLIPAYIGYIAGVSLSDLQEKGYPAYLKKIILSSLFYILGFSLIFILLGTAAAGFGGALRRYDHIIQRVGGAIILILGLEFAGLLKIPFLARERRLNIPESFKKLGYLRSFIIGIIFSISWSPCVSAVLGSILSLAAISATVYRGATLLFFYSLGISLPFMIFSLSLASAPKYLKFFSLHSGKISLIGGIILSILGLMLLTNTLGYLNDWIFDIVYKLGHNIR